MKKVLIAFFMIILASTAFAEYQAFDYRGSIRVPKMMMKGVDKTWQLKTEALRGILVTVCCYPCGGSFGKDYPSWLYLYRSGDRTTLWKVPVIVDGGIFGGNADVEKITNYSIIQRDDLSEQDKVYVKRLKKSWFMMNANFEKFEELTLDNDRVITRISRGFLGDDVKTVKLMHFGFGNAGYKIVKELKDQGIDFQPYVSSASGNLNGVLETNIPFSYDPSNFSGYEHSPIVGTFSVKFNSRLTKLVAGTADWRVIDSRIFTKFKYDELIEEDEVEEYQWATCY